MTIHPAYARFREAPAALSRSAFVDRFSAVYEHSAWVAERVFDQGLDAQHTSVSALANTMAAAVAKATQEEKLALIRAHPDLAGRAALKGELTDDSNTEQASAGLDQCSAEELVRFKQLNQAYKDKFDFPFIMAVRNSNRQQILEGFDQRLGNDPDTEFQRALSEMLPPCRTPAGKLPATVIDGSITSMSISRLSVSICNLR